MVDSRVDFLYLSEQDMIKAGVSNMAECLPSMEEMFKLLVAGDYRMGGTMVMSMVLDSHSLKHPMSPECLWQNQISV